MKVGLLGCGTIGSGVLTILDNMPKEKGIELVKVFDLPSKKELLKERFAETIDEVCLDKDIEVVVEALGGDKFPYECIMKALNSGKSVVTSNKEVVSMHLEEFYSLAKQKGVYFMCEASVGGGIPLICSLIESVKVNEISRIYGIINGTTNFILTNMDKNGMSFEDALSNAKKLGFAEYDATADLEGLDMTRKICILSSIAYKGYCKYENIYHYGISKVTKEILSDIKSLGYTLKFMAESKKENGNIRISVEPVLVKNDNPVSSVNYEYNAVYYDGSTNDTLGFYGKGAGKLPTATAMVNDIQRILDKVKPYYFENENSYTFSNFNSEEYYVYKDNKSSFVSNIDAKDYDFVARIFKV